MGFYISTGSYIASDVGTCALCNVSMPGCLACWDYVDCYVCDTSADFYLDPYFPQCYCNPPFYQINGVCNNPCTNYYPSCLECPFSGCYTCNMALGVLLGEGDCYCRYGYWNGTGCGFCNAIVANCSNSCSQDTSTVPPTFYCYGCEPPFMLNNNQCDCPAPAYYLQGAMCLSCSQAITGCL